MDSFQIDRAQGTTNLLLFRDFVLEEIEKGNQVAVLFADFSKAFDRIPHNKLIGKLSTFGFAPQAIKWLASYLTGRKQSVRIGSHDSGLIDVTSGVPQGSHIGQALFIIHRPQMKVKMSENGRYKIGIS